MNIVKWTPWREMATLNNRFNRFFDDLVFSNRWLTDELGGSDWNPVVDIFENDDGIVIKAELPGMDKKDSDIDIDDRVLTLKGERTHEKEVKEENYYRRERAHGKFHRAFRLPADVDHEKVKADFKDGILKIEIPKPEERKPKKISVH